MVPLPEWFPSAAKALTGAARFATVLDAALTAHTLTHPELAGWLTAHAVPTAPHTIYQWRRGERVPEDWPLVLKLVEAYFQLAAEHWIAAVNERGISQ